MSEPCGAAHPDFPEVTCIKPLARCFVLHNARRGIEPLTWPNPRQVPPPEPNRPKAAGIKRRAEEDDPVPVQRPVRDEDPETSQGAAWTTAGELRQSQQEVMYLFTGGVRLTDEEMLAVALDAEIKQSESGLRTRRSELVDLQLLRDSGERGLTKNGRQSIRWEKIESSATISA